MAEKQGVYILAEVTEDAKPASLTLELMGLGGELASKLGEKLYAVLMGHGLGATAEELAGCGAEEVFVLDDEALAQYNPDIYLPALEKLLSEKAPRAILFGHTSMGADLAPRLAFALKSGLVTDCVGVEADAGELSFVRPVYGGNAIATQKTNTDTVLATIRARVGEAPSPSGGSKVTSLEVEIPHEPRQTITSRERLESRECPLEEAPVVVTGGRGIGGEEGFDQLRELASLFKGAVGASRPPVDSGWAPTTCQVGITGKVVAPDIYIAVAISGSSQHLSGMSESGKIVAINKDPDAYIFSVSDYGVVGDWNQVLPPFLAKLKGLLSEGGA
jgi:electron transfer flavoprotein alpha subunit